MRGYLLGVGLIAGLTLGAGCSPFGAAEGDKGNVDGVANATAQGEAAPGEAIPSLRGGITADMLDRMNASGAFGAPREAATASALGGPTATTGRARTAKASTPRRVENPKAHRFEITDVHEEDGRITIRAGMVDGVAERMAFEIRRKGRVINRAPVVEIHDNLTLAEYDPKGKTPRPGDIVYSEELALAREWVWKQRAGGDGKLRVQVLEADPETRLVLLDCGRRQGVKPDMWFTIAGQDGFSGNARIRSVYDDVSTAILAGKEFKVRAGETAESLVAVTPPKPTTPAVKDAVMARDEAGPEAGTTTRTAVEVEGNAAAVAEALPMPSEAPLLTPETAATADAGTVVRETAHGVSFGEVGEKPADSTTARARIPSAPDLNPDLIRLGEEEVPERATTARRESTEAEAPIIAQPAAPLAPEERPLLNPEDVRTLVTDVTGVEQPAVPLPPEGAPVAAAETPAAESKRAMERGGEDVRAMSESEMDGTPESGVVVVNAEEEGPNSTAGDATTTEPLEALQPVPARDTVLEPPTPTAPIEANTSSPEPAEAEAANKPDGSSEGSLDAPTDRGMDPTASSDPTPAPLATEPKESLAEQVATDQAILDGSAPERIESDDAAVPSSDSKAVEAADLADSENGSPQAAETGVEKAGSPRSKEERARLLMEKLLQEHQ